MKRNLLLIFIACISGFIVNAQAFVYMTKEDFENNTPLKYTSYEASRNIGMRDIIVFKDGNRKIEIDGADMWGFTTQDSLFYRILKFPKLKKVGDPVLLIRQGGYCVFIKGGISETKKGNTKYFYEGIFYAKEFDGDVMGIDEFVKLYPEYKELKKCGLNLECDLEKFDMFESKWK